MKVGVSASGDSAVRAAHSLAAHPRVESLVILGPASSRFYEVVTDPTECDLLVVSGPDAPARFAETGVPMVWDGDSLHPGVSVWGASPAGLAMALAVREGEPAVGLVAAPDLDESREQKVRFPEPIGVVGVSEVQIGGRTLLRGRASNGHIGAMATRGPRKVAIVDEAAFMAGVALAAGALVAGGEPGPVWDDALGYLTAAAEMGLVMAEVAPIPS